MEKIFQLESDSDFKNDLEALFESLCGSKNENDLNAAIDDLKNILFKNNLKPEKIEEILQSKGFDENRINYFKMLLDTRKNELCYLALIYHNSLYGETTVNFNWNLKLVNGTSELLKLKYPILQLFLNTCHKGQSKQKVIDIDKNNLAKIIYVLEEVSSI